MGTHHALARKCPEDAVRAPLTIYVLAAASVPLLSTSGSQLLLTAAASSRPATAIASPAADRGNHDENGASAPVLPASASRALYSVRERELESPPRSPRFHAILRFGPSGAHSPVPATQSPSRRAQWLSRPALFRAAEGLVLTAASTAAD